MDYTKHCQFGEVSPLCKTKPLFPLPMSRDCEPPFKVVDEWGNFFEGYANQGTDQDLRIGFVKFLTTVLVPTHAGIHSEEVLDGEYLFDNLASVI